MEFRGYRKQRNQLQVYSCKILFLIMVYKRKNTDTLVLKKFEFLHDQLSFINTNFSIIKAKSKAKSICYLNLLKADFDCILL